MSKRKIKEGRPACDYVMMFKIVIMQRYYNLSDDSTEYAILDRLSFMRFLGLTISHAVPDSKTIWKLITSYEVTSASVHDSEELENLLDKKQD